MLVSIDFSSDEALYIQLKNQIILRIAASEIREGDNLPSVRELAENIGINMHTVNKAYTILKQEGYVKLDRRRGAVISIADDKLQAAEVLKNQMRMILAQAICKNIQPEEIHEVMDSILEEFMDADE